MHVLVTGGAGFIGSHSVEALLAAGHRVTVLDNLSSGKRANLPGSDAIRFLEGDIRYPADLGRAMKGVSHVLHLAAQVSVRASVDDPANSLSHNIAGFVNVLDAARGAGVKRVVYASSAAVYGTPAELPLTEESPTGPLSPYGLEKLVNDQYAALFRELYGLLPLGMRYFNVYGPRQDPASPYAGVISRFAQRIRENRPMTVFGDGGQTRDFVYVKDVARMNLLALGSEATGVCNVGTGTSVTLLQMIAALGEAAGRAPQVEHGAPAAGDIRHSAMAPRRLAEIFGPQRFAPLSEGLSALLADPGATPA